MPCTLRWPAVSGKHIATSALLLCSIFSSEDGGDIFSRQTQKEGNYTTTKLLFNENEKLILNSVADVSHPVLMLIFLHAGNS
jgi:hypothetical protein